MRRATFALAVVLTLHPNPSGADEVWGLVMDSIGFTGFGTPSGPLLAVLSATVPADVVLVARAIPGLTTCEALETTVPQLLSENPDIDRLMIVLGVNDALPLLECTADPSQTSRNLARMARMARAGGVRRVLLAAPVPALGSRGQAGYDFATITTDIGFYVRRYTQRIRRVGYVDLRTWFLADGWRRCAGDGIHPDNPECRQELATLIVNGFTTIASARRSMDP
jgi:hypothetical protein